MVGAVSVGRVEPLDAREAAAEILATLPEWFGRPEATAAYVAGAAERMTLLARRDGQAAGLVTLQPHFEQTLEIWLLAVHRAHHREGVGARLVAAAEVEARQQGRRWMMVSTVGPETEDAAYAATRAFYRAQGFCAALDAGENGGVQMIWMLRDLAEVRA